ncbi:MAG: hypothetical protein AAGD32_10710 [Planctomycetota bacterium]
MLDARLDTRPDARCQMETMEPRKLLAVGPDIVYATLSESQATNGDFYHEKVSAMRAELSPMMKTMVDGTIDKGGSDVDVFRVQLKKGQIFTADLNSTNQGVSLGYIGAPPPEQNDFSMELLDRRGNRMIKYDTAVDPLSGETSEDPAFAMRVKKSGTYYVRIASGLETDRDQNYEISLRTIGLNFLDMAESYLKHSSQQPIVTLRGETLTFSGPTGEGFDMVGNWTRTLRGDGVNKYAEYTATGEVLLRTGLGDIPISPDSELLDDVRPFKVTTKPHVWSNWYGELDKIEWVGDLALERLGGGFQRGFGLEMFGINGPQTQWGIKMGSDPLLQSFDMPLNPAQPYLFYSHRTGMNVKFGNFEASAPNSYGLNIVVDPADAFFIGGEGIPVVGDVGIGVSFDGKIPVSTDVDLRGDIDKDVYAHAWFKGGVDISQITPKVPLELRGEVFYDFDANDDGRNLDNSKLALDTLITTGGKGDSSESRFERAIQDIGIFANGEAWVGYEKKGFGFKMKVGEMSAGVRGDTGELAIKGGTINPFADVPVVGRYLAPSPQVKFDGYANFHSGDFDATLNGSWRMGVFPMTGTLRLDNNGIFADVRTNTPLGRANLTGEITPNSFDLRANANVNLGILDARANFRMYASSSQFKFSASLSGNYDLSVTIAGDRVGAYGYLNASATFGYGGSGLTMAVSGSGSITLDPPLIPRLTLSAGVKMNSRELGLNFKIDLPSPVPDVWIRPRFALK